jgi:hypothetical protein
MAPQAKRALLGVSRLGCVQGVKLRDDPLGFIQSNSRFVARKSRIEAIVSLLPSCLEAEPSVGCRSSPGLPRNVPHRQSRFEAHSMQRRGDSF